MNWQSFFEQLIGHLLSGPAIALYLFLIFKKRVIGILGQLETLVEKRGLTVKGPGGTGFSVPPPTQSDLETRSPGEAEEGIISATPEQNFQIVDYVTGIIEELEAVKLEKGTLETKLKDLLTEKEWEIIYWRINYLNCFLIPTTKRVLEWFTIFTAGTTRHIYHESWKGTITDPAQRDVMLRVLLQSELLVGDEGNVKITPFGEYFVKVTKGEEILPSPPPPSPPSLGPTIPPATS
jgi:hypothetical protein